MRRTNRFAKWLGVLLCTLAVQAVFAVTNGEPAKIVGLIVDRTGDTLTVKTRDAGVVAVVLTDATQVRMPRGIGIRKDTMSATALIPGLRITVEGVGDAKNQLVARKISFSKDDLEIAEQVEAAQALTQQNVETNKQNIATNAADIQKNKEGIDANRQEIEAVNQRFDDLTRFDIKGAATVYFKSGSAVISAKDKAALKALAHDAVNLKGYIIQVKGFTDSSGSAARNQTLSMERAQAVVAYLLQECNVPIRHVIAPGAMAETNAAASNETTKGRSENRRVEVKVLVNKGLAGDSNPGS